MDEDVETRTVMTLRTGTKICALVGVAFIVLAIYFFFVPITSVRTGAGAVFGCGSALNPSHGGFANGVCGDIAHVNRDRAFATLAIGLLTIIGGALMFGVDRHEEQRAVTRDRRAFDDRTGSRGDADWDDHGGSRRDWDTRRASQRGRRETGDDGPEDDDRDDQRSNRRPADRDEDREADDDRPARRDSRDRDVTSER